MDTHKAKNKVITEYIVCSKICRPYSKKVIWQKRIRVVVVVVVGSGLKNRDFFFAKLGLSRFVSQQKNGGEK